MAPGKPAPTTDPTIDSGIGSDGVVIISSAPPGMRDSSGAASTVLRALREGIIAGEFEPNTKMKFDDLRERYSASVGTLREALLQLQSDGFVKLESNRGFTVAPASAADLLDITELRVQFEIQAVRDAILHGGDDWEAEIVTSLHLLQRLIADGTPPSQAPEWPERHRRFHTALVAACRSPWLLHFRSVLFDQAERYRSLGRKYRRSPRDVSGEHKAMADAALARDADLACRLAEKHIRSTVENVLGNVPELQAQADSKRR